MKDSKIATALGLLREPYKGWFVLAVLGSVVIAGLDMLGVAAMLPLMQVLTGADPHAGIPGYFARALDTDEPRALILAIATVVAVAFVLKSVLTVGFRWWLLGHTTRMSAQAAAELFTRYVSAPYVSHRRRRLSEIHRALSTGVPQTFSQVVLGYLTLVPDVLSLLLICAVLLAISPAATLVTVVFFATITWGLQRVLRPVHRRIGEDLAAADLQAWDALMPGINGFREARLSAAQTRFVRGFERAKLRSARASRWLSLLSELPKYVLEIGLIVGVCLIAAVTFQTVDAAAALSILGVFAAAATRMLPLLNRVFASLAGIRAGGVGLEILVTEIRGLDADGFHRPTGTSEPDGEYYQGDIRFQDVTFSFPDSPQPVLNEVTTTIEAGSTVAFVGGSGAGKSTLLDLLLGLLEPTEGTISCGGRNIHDDLAAWYAGIAVVPQDVFVLDDTVRANIAFGVPAEAVDEARLADAVRRAQLEPIIAGLPNGFETTLGERGVRMSGGQRQRIGIARALYRRPSVLVLDEATSALDNLTEKRITETLEALHGELTIVIVAHRLSTVRHADRVVFMAQGRIETEGSFAQVEQRNKDFAQLVALGKLS